MTPCSPDGRAGKPGPDDVYGRNLPGGTLTGASIDGPPLEKLAVIVTRRPRAKLLYRGRVEAGAGRLTGSVPVEGPGGSSNGVFIAFAQDRVITEKEPNDRPDQATDLPGACEVAGRIDKRNDRDWFAVPAKKGETYVVDLWADRIGVPTDFLISVRPPKAQADTAEKDDNPEILSNTQFYSRTTDPDPITFTAAEDGK